jgi:hypothetical protein
VLLALLLAAACGRESAAPARPAAPLPAAARQPERPPELPPAGEVRVLRSGERYTVLANGAPPAAALAALADAADLETEVGSEPLPDVPLHLALRELALERALAAILRGVAFDVRFEPGPREPGAAPAARATRVLVGAPAAAPLASAPPPRAARAPAEAARPGAREPRPKEEQEGADERERLAFVAARVGDPRESVRIEAIEHMDPENDEERGILERLLRGDPSGDVRIAAAQALAEGNAFLVTDVLLAALDDPAPELVAASVRALEDVYAEAPNPRVRERVQALREHRDAEVRQAVSEFEEWIQE